MVNIIADTTILILHVSSGPFPPRVGRDIKEIFNSDITRQGITKALDALFMSLLSDKMSEIQSG